MERLIYLSTASVGVDGGDVFNVINIASQRNPDRGITGFLIFANGLFFQYIEGETAALDELLADLQRDPRHHSLRVLDRRRSASRAFGGWKMRRLFAAEQVGAPEVLLDQLRELGMAPGALEEVQRCLTARAA